MSEKLIEANTRVAADLRKQILDLLALEPTDAINRQVAFLEKQVDKLIQPGVLQSESTFVTPSLSPI